MSTFTDDWNDHAPRATVTVLGKHPFRNGYVQE